jgi:hypothetical protein
MNEEDEQTLSRINEKLDKITEQSYYAVGTAISLWSRMEGSLVHIASWLLDARSEKVGLVFYSINNFHTWLSIIEELFEINPAFSPLKSEWNAIAKKLRGLNDIRVRLAHHSFEPGRDIIELAENELDFAEAYPALKPHELDGRAKWKKKAIGIEEILAFEEEVVTVIEKLTDFMHRIDPIYMAPKRRFLANIKELQRKAALWDAHEKGGD